MKQRVSNTVQETVKRMFSPESQAVVMEILDRYGVESHERERERVQLAILKLSGGDVNELRANLEAAKQDYRDVLAYAESPREMRHSAQEMLNMDADTARSLRSEERKQHLEWLKGRVESEQRED